MIPSTGTSLYSILKMAEAMPEVACVAIFRHGKILMGRRRDNHLWTQPGGHLEEGESPLEGAVREVKEEAGIDIEPHTLKHLATEIVTKPDGKKIKVHAYRAVIHKAPTSIKEDPDAEVHRWHWLSLETLFSPKVWGELHVKPEENVVMRGLGFVEMQKSANEKRRIAEFYLKRAERQDGQQKVAKDFTAALGRLAERRGTTLDKLLKAPKHPDSWYPKDQVAKGMIVEKEHSDDPKIRSTITKNHLDERRDYYNDSLFKSDLQKEGSEMKNFWDGFEKQAAERSSSHKSFSFFGPGREKLTEEDQIKNDLREEILDRSIADETQMPSRPIGRALGGIGGGTLGGLLGEQLGRGILRGSSENPKLRAVPMALALLGGIGGAGLGQHAGKLMADRHYTVNKAKINKLQARLDEMKSDRK